MSDWIIQNRENGETVYAYTADFPDHSDIYPFSDYNHILRVVVPNIEVREVSGVSYLRRFTQEERIAIRSAANSSAVLDDYLKLLDATIQQGGLVNLDDEDTVKAVNLLEQYGLIANGRSSEILS